MFATCVVLFLGIPFVFGLWVMSETFRNHTLRRRGYWTHTLRIDPSNIGVGVLWDDTFSDGSFQLHVIPMPLVVYHATWKPLELIRDHEPGECAPPLPRDTGDASER